MIARRPKAASVIAWVVSVSLIVSPLMAQTTSPTGASDPIRALIGSRTDPVGTAMRRAVPISVAAVPNVASRATTATPARAAAQDPRSPGKKTKWGVLLGILAVGAAGAAYALWPRGDDGGGGGGPQSQPGPGGTVIVAGTPNVSTPNR